MRSLLAILLAAVLILAVIIGSIKFSDEMPVKKETYENVIYVVDAGANIFNNHGKYVLFLNNPSEVKKINSIYLTEIVESLGQEPATAGRVEVEWVKKTSKFFGTGNPFVKRITFIGVKKENVFAP